MGRVVIWVVLSLVALGATESDELMQVHGVTTEEMHNLVQVSEGSLAYDTNESKIYYHDDSQWRVLDSLNIYNANGVLSGYRTVYMGSNNLSFLGEGYYGIGTSNQKSKLHIQSPTTTELTIEGASSGYVNAAVVLKATHDTHVRGLGIFMHDKNGETEWYAGRPYASSDAYIIARASNVSEHNTSTARTQNTLVSVQKSGNLEVSNQIAIMGGTPGEGKVLTSDSNGLATWKTPYAFEENLAIESSRITYENYNASFLLHGDSRDYQYTHYLNGDTRTIVRDYSAPGASGALRVKGYGGLYEADDLIAINPSKRYRGVVAAMQPTSNSTGAIYYFGVTAYDADKQFIRHYMVNYYGNSVTTLSQALNTGDTLLHLDDASDWINSGDHGYQKVWGVWRLRTDGKYAYVGAGGKQYDELGYTREGQYNAWSDGDVDTTNNTITLKSPWSGPNIPAGTKIANFYGGGTYTYYISAKTQPNDGEWHTYKSSWRQGEGRPQDHNGNDSAANNGVLPSFRNGTSYIRIMALPNYRDENYDPYDSDNVGYYSIMGIEATSPDSFTGKNNVISYQGKVGIGTPAPSVLLQVGESGDGTSALANAWNTFSDRRWKRNIKPLENALETIEALQGVSYQWKKSNKKAIGFIAQDVQKVLPTVVTEDNNGYLSIDYSKLTPLLVESIKAQQKLIEQLQEEMRVLKKRMGKSVE